MEALLHNETTGYHPISHYQPEDRECKLIAGPVAWTGQLVLFTAVSATLIYKWLMESPRRPYRTWILDVSKQGFSTCAAHMCGVTIAIITSHHAHNASQCAWYGVVFLMDTTLGVTIAIVLHTTLVTLARRAQRQRVAQQAAADKGSVAPLPGVWWEAMCEPGRYGDPVRWGRWFLQMVVWVVCTVLGRVACGIAIVNGRRGLEGLPIALDRAFEGNREAELFAIMVTFPLVMNALQAYVQDHVLKWRASGHSAVRASVPTGASALSMPSVAMVQPPAAAVAAAAAAAAGDGGGGGGDGKEPRKSGQGSKPVVVVMPATDI